ncbi:MAG: NYN domain-containing protein [Gammaproteobacteria bacterium]|nr:MAG: NYN domain-containing protein [Gammaproteobacteria bacterium]
MANEVSTPGSKRPSRHQGVAEPGGFILEPAAAPVVTAVLVDAAFFVKRIRRLHGKDVPPEVAARKLHATGLKHLNIRDGARWRRIASLHRIFVYDGRPPTWKGHAPVSGAAIDVGRSQEALWRAAFHEALRKMRKVALRLGRVASPRPGEAWRLRSSALRDLRRGRLAWGDLQDHHFELDLRQKGVDMRLGLDVASLSFKRQVNQIVLVACDADFVPAAKLARREGIDVVLDPMRQKVPDDLAEHVDGIRTVWPAPGQEEGSEPEEIA